MTATGACIPIHWPCVLHDVPLLHVPQLSPQVGSGPHALPLQLGTHWGTHWPEVLLQVSLPLHVPQLTPQVGSGPHSLPLQLGTQLETHWPEVLSQVVLPLHVPQLTPQVGSGPQKRPAHAGTQFAAAEAFVRAAADCTMEGAPAEASAPSTQPNTQRLDVIRNAGISSRKVLMSWISIQGIDSSWIAGRPA